MSCGGNVKTNIILLTDYKNRFGSKYTAKPYRSGMDKDELKKNFDKLGYDIKFLQFSEVNFRENWKNKFVLYTSQEDDNYLYKNFIEDIIYGLELAGARVIPSYKFLKANNNKIFMEILRDISDFKEIQGISSSYYGCLEELSTKKNITYPIVIKTATGAMSKGVSSAADYKELISNIKTISRSKNVKYELRDSIRALKHKGYLKDSRHRQKFITQNMIEGLSNDYKVLVFGNRLYYLRRDVRDNDFRASGSGKFRFEKECPPGMLEYAYRVFRYFDVPNISLDVCFDGENFHVIEFQALYFGSTTIEKAPFFCRYSDREISYFEEKSNLEEVYMSSIVQYLDNEYR